MHPYRHPPRSAPPAADGTDEQAGLCHAAGCTLVFLLLISLLRVALSAVTGVAAETFLAFAAAALAVHLLRRI
jgi:hypothetical protein